MNIDNIDSEQKNIVEKNPDEPLLVFAGPGSGKTLVLIARLIYIIQYYIQIYGKLKKLNLLMLTYSKSAKTEMRDRVDIAMKQKQLICNVQIFTFHSYAFYLVKNYYKKVGFNSFPIICSRSESLKILEEAVIELSTSNSNFNRLVLYNTKDHKEKILFKNKLMTIIKDAKGCETIQKSRAYIIARFQDKFEYGDLFDLFQSKLLEKGYMQFSDMLVKAIELLNNNNDVLFEVRSKINYILVDEFQDTNDLQLTLLLKIIQNGKVTVVGDNDQLIYRFQGANDVNFNKLKEKYKCENIIVNEEYINNNYRSAPPIVKACNNLINYDGNSTKNMIATGKYSNDNDNKIIIMKCTDEENEYENIFSHIEKLQIEKLDLNEIAILCRYNEDVLKIKKYLKEKKIKSKKKVNGGDEDDEKFCGDKINRLVYDLRLACNEDLINSYNEDFLNAIPDNLNNECNQSIEEITKSTSSKFSKLFDDNMNIYNKNKKVYKQLIEWWKRIKILNNTIFINQPNLDDIIKKAVPIKSKPVFQNNQWNHNKVNNEEDVDSDNDDDDDKDFDQQILEKLLKLVIWYNKHHIIEPKTSLKVQLLGYIDKVKTIVDDLEGYLFESPILLENYDNNDYWQQQKKRYEKNNKVKTNDKDKIYIGTIHSSKGLQFKAVILMKADDITLNGNIDETNQLFVNDERRLVYVAMSRAMKYLYISYPIISKTSQKGGRSLELSDLIKPLLKYSELVIRKENGISSPIANQSSTKQYQIEKISRNILSNDFNKNNQYQSTSFTHHSNPNKISPPPPYKSILHQSLSSSSITINPYNLLCKSEAPKILSTPSSHDVYGKNNNSISLGSYNNQTSVGGYNDPISVGSYNNTQTSDNLNYTQSINNSNYNQYSLNNSTIQNSSSNYNNNHYSSSNKYNNNNNINNNNNNIYSNNLNNYEKNSKKRQFESFDIDNLDDCDESLFDSLFKTPK